MERQPWTPAGGRECSTQSRRGRGLGDAWISDFRPSKWWEDAFLLFQAPRSVLLESISLEKQIHFLSVSRHMRSFPITASTRLVPTLRFFPTLAFQTWIQSFGSWEKCFFLKDALWACSTWTSRIYLSWLCLGETQGWWGSLRNQLCAASPRPHLWPPPHRTLLNIELRLQHHLLTENFLDCPNPCTPRLYHVTLFYSLYPLNYAHLIFISHLHTGM